MFVLLLALGATAGPFLAATARATTPTPTLGKCPRATPELLSVDPVVSPTDELAQTVYVRTGNVDRLEITSEAGTFIGESPFDRVTVSLLPNTANHLRVTVHVPPVVQNGCMYGDYTLSTTTDLHGAPLTIVQGTMHGPTIAIDPPTRTVRCSGDFDIHLRNTSQDDEVLEISYVSLHHAYSQGDYGTDFTWDTSAIDLPLALSPGGSVSIPVSYRGDGLFNSRLVLQVVSNARNNDTTQYVPFFGKLCATPTLIPPTPTATPTPTSTPYDDTDVTLLPGQCVGDCNGDGQVDVGEVVTAIGIALDKLDPDDCPGFGTQQVDIASLVAAVDNALDGCPSIPVVDSGSEVSARNR